MEDIFCATPSFKELLKGNKKKSLYFGVDPTSDLLHIGHLVLLAYSTYLQSNFGFEVYIIIGNFTACIGDPTFKTEARSKMSPEKVDSNTQIILEVIKRISNIFKLEFTVLYNKDWLSEISLLDIIRLFGDFKVEKLMKFDIFANKKDEVSILELLYPMLQGYDFFFLHQKYGINLQIGGQDQWTNMLMGYDLISKIGKDDHAVVSLPLITDINGVKIGKTAGQDNLKFNHLCNPITVWQNLRNMQDIVCEQAYKIFKHLTHHLSDINAQKIFIAFQITQALFGKTTATSVQIILASFYNKEALAIDKIDDPHLLICKSKFQDMKILDIIAQKTNLSKNLLRTYLQQKQISINHEPLVENIVIKELKTGILYVDKNHIFVIKNL